MPLHVCPAAAAIALRLFSLSLSLLPCMLSPPAFFLSSSPCTSSCFYLPFSFAFLIPASDLPCPVLSVPRLFHLLSPPTILSFPSSCNPFLPFLHFPPFVVLISYFVSILFINCPFIVDCVIIIAISGSLQCPVPCHSTVTSTFPCHFVLSLLFSIWPKSSMQLAETWVFPSKFKFSFFKFLTNSSIISFLSFSC